MEVIDGSWAIDMGSELSVRLPSQSTHCEDLQGTIGTS